MSSPAAGPLRLARAAALAGVTVALAAVAHVLGGGALPAPAILAAIVAFAFGAAVVATGSRVGLVGALGLLGVGQVLLHEAFALVGRAVCVMPGVPAGPHAGHGVAAASSQLAALSASAAGVGAAPTGAVPAGGCAAGIAHVGLGATSMLVLHALATVVTAVVLAGGERALWWLAAWLRPRTVDADLPVLTVAARPVVGRARLGASRLLRASCTLRGPPTRALAPA